MYIMHGWEGKNKKYVNNILQKDRRLGELNEKIKRKAHVKQSFSLDFLERGTFTEYPCLKRNADDTDYFINIVLSAFRHLCFISSCDYLISCCSVAQFLRTLYLLPSVGFVWKAGVRFLQYRGIGQRVFV